MLGTNMVKEGFGVAGGDVRIGAEILVRAALEEGFAAASGQYFDNDKGRFAQPHRDALDPRKSQETIRAMDAILDSPFIQQIWTHRTSSGSIGPELHPPPADRRLPFYGAIRRPVG